MTESTLDPVAALATDEHADAPSEASEEAPARRPPRPGRKADGPKKDGAKRKASRKGAHYVHRMKKGVLDKVKSFRGGIMHSAGGAGQLALMNCYDDYIRMHREWEKNWDRILDSAEHTTYGAFKAVPLFVEQAHE